MLGCIFGWNKACKCKKEVKYLQCHLWQVKKRRDSIVRQSREDIARLIKNGNFKSAFGRVEQLYKDQSELKAYNQLDQFCEFILLNFRHIRRNRDCPDNINEAVSSLIFAAPRCGDLPELQILRNLFGELYGENFAVAAVELYPGNQVNKQISDRLSMKIITDDMKLKLIKDIVMENIPQFEYQDIENAYKLQEVGYKLQDQQVDSPISRNSNCESKTEASGMDIQVVYNDNEGEKIRSAEYLKDSGLSLDSVMLLDNSSERSNQGTPCPSKFSIVSLQLQHTMEGVTAANVSETPARSLKLHKSSEQSNLGIPSPSRFSTISLQHQMEGVPTASVSESPTHSPDCDIIYLEDEADLLLPSMPEESKGEQKLRFILISTSPHLRCKCRRQHSKNHTMENKMLKFSSFKSPLRDSRVCSSDVHHCDSNLREFQDEKSSYRYSSKNRKSNGQTSEWRPTSRHRQSCNNYEDHEHAGFLGTNSGYVRGIYDSREVASVPEKDVEFAWYYGKATDNYDINDPRHHLKPKIHQATRSNSELHNRRPNHEKYQLQRSREGCKSSSFKASKKKLLLPHQSSTVAEICCQEHECNTKIHRCYCNRRSQESYSCNHKMDHYCYLEHPCYLVATFNQDDGEKRPSFKHHGGGGNLRSFSHDVQLQRDKEYTTNQGHPKQQSKNTGEGRLPPYVKTKKAPAKQPDITPMNQILGTDSFELQKAKQPNNSCSHVHPKLPDYDDLEAKFTALKKEHMQRRFSA